MEIFAYSSKLLGKSNSAILAIMENSPLYEAIRRYAARLLSDNDVAHDIVQEVFLRLQTATPENPKTYGYRIARNLVIDRYRKKRADVLPDNLPADATMFNPAMIAEHKEMSEMIQNKMNALPPRHREVLRLKFQEGLKYAEIADVLGVPITTVAWLIHEAVAMLRKELVSRR